MDTEQHNLTLLFVREGSLTVARCLEHDIVAQGQSIEEALSAWADVFAAQIIIDVRRGREPLEGIGPAPERYFDMFKRAKRLGSPARDRLRLRHVQAGQAPRLARS